MLRTLASGVSGLADSFSPLYRSPDEQLASAWGKASAALHRDSASASATQRLTALEDSAGGGLSAEASPAAAPTSAVDAAESTWCNAALLRSLNHLVDALRRDTTHTARRPARTRRHSNATQQPHKQSQQHTAGSSSDSPPALNHSPLPPSPPSGVAVAAASDIDPSADSPCVAYLLRHCVVEQLCALGVSARPAGMRPVVLRTVDALLSCPHTSALLAAPAVCGAVSQLLAACAEKGEERGKASRRSVLSLCRAISAHIGHSSLVADSWLAAVPDVAARPLDSGCHLLCAMLVSMSNFWADEGGVCTEALFDLACSPSRAVHTALLQSGCVESLVGGVVELLAQLPPVSLSPPIDALLSEHAAGRALSGRLSLLDALCLCAPASIVLPLCSDFRVRVLEGVLAPLLCDVREDVAGWTSRLLTAVVRRTDSQALARTIAACLLAVIKQTQPSGTQRWALQAPHRLGTGQ